MKLKDGFYMNLKNGCHTYGIHAVGEIPYNKLMNIYWEHANGYGWFLQGDSSNSKKDNHTWLFVEFIGQSLTQDEALEQCQRIADLCQIELIDFI